MNHYKWQKVESNKTLTFSELIGEASFTNPITENNIDHYLSIFDDFLLLVSFAEGQRCVIPKLDIYSTDKHTEIYRLDRTLPKISANHSFNDFVIGKKYFDNFLNKTWEILNGSEQYELIKTVLEANINDSHSTMESNYLKLFSSIETLILAFRIENELEKIFHEGKTWKAFRGQVKELIKAHDYFKKNKNYVALIYQNINGLNKISLQYAFKKFVSQKNLRLNDLWPFSSDRGDCSLTAIRNRLVHGYGVNENYIDSFITALDNLEYYAKRLLLATLDWDISKSKLFRKNESYIEAWQEARENLKNWK